MGVVTLLCCCFCSNTSVQYTPPTSHGALVRSSVIPSYLPWYTDHTHIILIGSNEPFRLFDAFTRYSVGGDGYQDPVDFDMVFKTVDGKPEITFEPMVRVRIAWLMGWLIDGEVDRVGMMSSLVG